MAACLRSLDLLFGQPDYCRSPTGRTANSTTLNQNAVRCKHTARVSEVHRHEGGETQQSTGLELHFLRQTARIP